MLHPAAVCGYCYVVTPVSVSYPSQLYCSTSVVASLFNDILSANDHRAITEIRRALVVDECIFKIGNSNGFVLHCIDDWLLPFAANCTAVLAQLLCSRCASNHSHDLHCRLQIAWMAAFNGIYEWLYFLSYNCIKPIAYNHCKTCSCTKQSAVMKNGFHVLDERWPRQYRNL